jgi:hypothetical protein
MTQVVSLICYLRLIWIFFNFFFKFHTSILEDWLDINFCYLLTIKLFCLPWIIRAIIPVEPKATFPVKL